MPSDPATPAPAFPYKIAVLCDLRDEHNRLLLLKRAKDPNKGLYSPIGGKLDTHMGESPARCAQREIEEEAGAHVPMERLRLTGIISEHGYQGTTNWLMFWYRVLGPCRVEERTMNEGDLEWHALDRVMSLALPETDRTIIWPLALAHDGGGLWDEPGFFSVHVECAGERGERLDWTVQQSRKPGRG
jgi:8-oxo-dGTP diphosphatase